MKRISELIPIRRLQKYNYYAQMYYSKIVRLMNISKLEKRKGTNIVIQMVFKEIRRNDMY